MKPSNFKQRQPADNADALVAELAGEMIAYVATLYEHAPEEEKLDLILRYGPTLHTLQRVIGKAARQPRRGYPGKIEKKGA
jgi:hypothetical protein